MIIINVSFKGFFVKNNHLAMWQRSIGIYKTISYKRGKHLTTTTILVRQKLVKSSASCQMTTQCSYIVKI